MLAWCFPARLVLAMMLVRSIVVYVSQGESKGERRRE